MAKRSGRGRQAARTRTATPAGTAVAVRTAPKPPPLPGARLGKAGAWTPTPRTPALIEASLARSGMDGSTPFGPGRPLNPYQGYSQPPRDTDYPTGVNISTRTRSSWGLPSYETMRAIIAAYDVARDCINHKIDELRSMEPMFLPAKGVRGDVSAAIEAAEAVLEFPDRDLPYEDWLSKWLENALKFGTAPLYRRRDYDGNVIALESLDATTVYPYVDERGRRPRAPDPAYYQLIKGQPWNWYTHQDLDYRMWRPQENAPFGLAPIESILLTANTDIRFQWHFLQMFTDGSIPGGFVELPPDVSSPDQVAEWQDYWDAMVMGDQAKLHQLIAVPAGTKITNTKPDSFSSAFPEYLMTRTCAAYGVVPQDIGLVKDVNRANGETQVDIQFRVNTLPWVKWVEGTLSRYLRLDIGLPVQVKLNTGRDKEDRKADAEAWKIYIETGMASADEGREELLGLPVDNERPTPRFFNNTRLGPIPLRSIEAVSGKTDPDTHGPSADEPIPIGPYVGPIGVVPQAGTADAKQSLAAVDANQVADRQQLLAEQQAQQAQQTKESVPTAADAPTVAKSAAAGEIEQFNRYVKTWTGRGRWPRDFQFDTVAPAVAAQLNAAGRDAVAKKAKPAGHEIPADAAPAHGGANMARTVYDQLAEDYPTDRLGWVLHMDWAGPQLIDLDDVDFAGAADWQAAHEPAKVERFVKKIKRGRLKPVVLVARPGMKRLVVVDGHHRALAYRHLKRPAMAYVGRADEHTGPWDELHSFQATGHGAGGADLYRAEVAKDGGPVAAGLAVLAADTGRVLMLQRAVDDLDPASGTWEFPGGKLEPEETAAAAAAREWSEETGLPLPAGGALTGRWASANGVYAGFVYTIPQEADLAIFGDRGQITNPDDPDGDQIEALAWWDPAQLPGNPAVRDELAADLGLVLAALGVRTARRGDTAVCPCGMDAVFGLEDSDWWSHADGSIGHDDGSTVAEAMGLPTVTLKAGDDPKAPAPQGPDTARSWPGWDRDLALAGIYADRIRQALTDAVDPAAITARWAAARPVAKAAGADPDASAAARRVLSDLGLAPVIDDALGSVLDDAHTEGYLLGVRAAVSMTASADVDWRGWIPGDADAANRVLGADGLGAGLRQMLDASGITITSIGQGRFDELAQALALSLERGDSADTLAADLRDILDDGRWAQMVAITEINRAVSAATLDTYGAMGVRGKEWMTAADQRVCPTCDRNAGDGPIPLDASFSSGDAAPPGHPVCRCALGPADLPGGERG